MDNPCYGPNTNYICVGGCIPVVSYKTSLIEKQWINWQQEWVRVSSHLCCSPASPSPGLRNPGRTSLGLGRPTILFTLVPWMLFLPFSSVTDGAPDSSDIWSPKGEGSAQILILLLVWSFKYTNRFFYSPVSLHLASYLTCFNALCIWTDPETFSLGFLLILLYV